MSALIKHLLQQKRAELEDARILVKSLREDIRNITAQLPISKSDEMRKGHETDLLSHKTNGEVGDTGGEEISMYELY